MALPTRENPVKATRIGPKILVLYSLPKVGKTEALVQLAEMVDCLILDTEEGTRTYDTTAIQVTSVKSITDTIADVNQEGAKRAGEGMKGIDLFPYKFIALDTLDQFEDFAEASATAKYKAGPMNKNGKFEANGFTSVTELAEGYGYRYLRKEMTDTISLLASRCPYLILIVHVKEKLMLNKSNQEVKVNDISLTGKLAAIVSALADAIGYMYRNPQGELRVSFQTFDGAVMGARPKYLAGKDIPFSWETIYPDVFPPKTTNNV